MSQYKTGTVSVTNGSQVVTGTGTAWLANVNVGDGFVLAGVPVPYTISSVDSNTQIKLSAPWSGSSASGSPYAIFRDFTTYYNLPEMSQGDIETATIYTRAMRQIDQLQASSVVEHEAAADPHPQYLLDTRYEQDRLREALLKEATLNLDFANNKYEVYEGPVDSLTQRPFNDVLDFSRSSAASARNATGGLTEVLADQQRLVGNREGLLIEEQRTNLHKYSEQMDNAANSKAGITVTANVPSVTAPDGTNNSDRAIEDTSVSSQHRFFQSFSITGGVTYTFSVYCRPGSGNRSAYLGMSFGSSAGSVARVYFDLETESVIGTKDSPVRYSIEKASGGFYRISVTGVAEVTGTGSMYFGMANGTSETYTGDGSSGHYFWGAQLEQGAFPTSYIKTEGSQVTRAADNCSRTLGAEFNPNEGTFYIEALSYGFDVAASALRLPNDSVVIQFFGDKVRFFSGPTGEVSLGNNYPEKGVFVRAAFSYSESGVVFAVNGASASTSILPDIAGSAEAYIGGEETNPERFLNGIVKDSLHIPLALTAAELEALTS